MSASSLGFFSASNAAEPAATSPWVLGLKGLGSLVLVLGLILLCYAALRRWSGWLPQNKGQSRMRILEMRAIGPKKSLCLVRIDDQELLLAVGQERIDKLWEAPAVEEPDPTMAGHCKHE